MMNKENIVWKTYPDYPFIQANQFGEIRTVDRIVINKAGREILIKGRMLKQSECHAGYLRVGFKVNGKHIDLRVHRIIATCFLPNPENLPEVNHKDNNPKNNSVENLEWCTRQYNIAYKEKYGKSAAEVSGRPVFAVNLKTFEVLYFKSQCEAARQLKTFKQSIHNVLKGLAETSVGYWFCEADENAIENTRAKFGDEVAGKVQALLDEKIEN